MASSDNRIKVVTDNGPMGYVLFVAYIGAAIYFVQQHEGLAGFVLGLLQAAVWPAYVLYHILRLLGA